MCEPPENPEKSLKKWEFRCKKGGGGVWRHSHIEQSVRAAKPVTAGKTKSLSYRCFVSMVKIVALFAF